MTLHSRLLTGALLLAGVAVAQTVPAAAPPKFEVVSIKPIAEAPPAHGSRGMRITPGRFHDGDFTVEGLIRYAYNVQYWETVAGGEAWDHFDGRKREYAMDATFDPAATPDQIRLMARAVLADWFKLHMHMTTRMADFDELTVAPGGAKFLGDAAPAASRRPGTWGCTKSDAGCVPTTIASFCGSLAIYTQRRVVDKTGLMGAYYIQIWSRETVAHFLSQADADASGAPSIFTALQEQLGLRLVATKGLLAVYYVDHVENPTLD